MDRRELLRRCAGGLAVTGTVGLAGCGGSDEGNGGGDTPDSEDNGPEPTENEPMATSTEIPPTTTASSEPTTTAAGGVEGAAEATVDGLAVVEHEHEALDADFRVRLVVRNTGEQTTDIFEYEYSLQLYDSMGASINGNGSSYGTTNDTEVEPGESAPINAQQTVSGDPADVARYEVTVGCEGMFVEGVYCGN